MNDKHIDQLINAIEADQLELAAALVRNATGATEKQAMEVVLTFMEGMEDAEGRGVSF